jgi:hypothetical protein
VALVCGHNPTKVRGSNKLLPRLAQIFDGWRKEDPPTTKQLPVEADVPELLAERGRKNNATQLDKAIGDLTIITFYYLLRIGEYTVKGKRNETKQTVQFKYEDVTFFKKNAAGQLRCLPRTAAAHLITTADGATMKLDNQKNGWKGVCVYHETNGEEFLCPVRALGRRYVHIRKHGGTKTTTLSSYWVEGTRADVTAENISRALKLATTELQYPTNKGIPISRINTHSLRSGGANSLALNGYSDTQIQKMGRWRGATFKEYIREELACYARNMSRDMKRKFNFVNIAGNAFTEIPHTELHIIEPEE